MGTAVTWAIMPLYGFFIVVLPIILMGWSAYFINKFDGLRTNASTPVSYKEKISYFTFFVFWILYGIGSYLVVTTGLNQWWVFIGVLLNFLVLSLIIFYVPIKLLKNKN